MCNINSVFNAKALVGAFNQEKAIVGAFSVIVKPVLEPMDRFTALVRRYQGDTGTGHLMERDRQHQQKTDD